MTNDMIWLVLLAVNYLLLALSFRLFRANGLFAWVALSSILANIQVVKTIELFGMVTTLGNIIYGTSFLATDILSECYSEKEANAAGKIGIFGRVAPPGILRTCLRFEPHSSDAAQGAVHSLLPVMPRIAIASITAYCVSQNFDVWFYNYLKIRFPEHLWVRNNGSTMLSQLIDNVIFTVLAFWGVFELDVLLQIFASTYLLKWIVALCDTPVIYWARAFHRSSIKTDISEGSDQGNCIAATACENSLADSALG